MSDIGLDCKFRNVRVLDMGCLVNVSKTGKRSYSLRNNELIYVSGIGGFFLMMR